ncbi:hypothetical protein QFC20_006760 [Naganishia adeliensis]|uniref:Uncharacterized protein n=1 Tax=Naganishia adeliensis TaxID=92952 RepID=A0ACC2V940_9TREE|nr:hypothetical protein QFC20_006760 [Naganishia adeliensis]
MAITAAVLAEICAASLQSALPLSGSIYIWAAEAAGPKHARLVGFVVAWWACTAWMTFVGSSMQGIAYYILSQLVVWEVDFPGGVDINNIKFRAVVWAVSEVLLIMVVALNYLPPKAYSRVFKFSMFLMILDFALCTIWLPIRVHKTYGFRTPKEVFTGQYNGTGAPAGWNWMLSFLYGTSSVVVSLPGFRLPSLRIADLVRAPLKGFDASGHVAEELKNASTVAARGILLSQLVTGGCAFAATILWLFCTPPLDVWFDLYAPQPFVQIYALALGKGPSVFMTILAVVGLILNASIATVAASRLVFAVARDGVLPFSSWVGTVTDDGRPKNAVTVMYCFGAVLLCTILPSNVAFTSLVSAGGIPTIAAYSLIAFCRLVFTPNSFKNTRFGLGVFARPFYAIAFLWNGVVFVRVPDADLHQVYASPFSVPTTGKTFNYSSVIFGGATLFGILTWWWTPSDAWLPKQRIEKIDQEVEHRPSDASDKEA